MKRLYSGFRIIASIRVALGLALVALALSAGYAPVQAQATRTWVSGVGDDVNPCSRTAPCKTFAGAISKTAAGGEINCLDPGGFGAITITKSITIDCSGTFGSILASGTNGVNINDTAGVVGGMIVTLRGISINAGGDSGPGFVGINIIKAAAVNIEDCRIFGFNGGSARGIFAPGNVTAGQFLQLAVKNTSIFDNGVNASGGGISGGGGVVIGQVPPAVQNAGVVRATLSNVDLIRNNIGLRSSPATETTIVHSRLEHSISFNMIVASGGSAAIVNADDSAFSESIAGTGIHSEGVGAVVRISRSIISGNNTGLASVNGGAILSAGNNFIQGNFGSNGAPTGPAPLQ